MKQQIQLNQHTLVLKSPIQSTYNLGSIKNSKQTHIERALLQSTTISFRLVIPIELSSFNSSICSNSSADNSIFLAAVDSFIDKCQQESKGLFVDNLLT